MGLVALAPYPIHDGAPDMLRASLATQRSYPSDDAMLAGELAHLQRSIDPSSGSSLYASFSLGYPLVTTIFSRDDTALKQRTVAMMADLIRSLPRYGELVDRFGDGPALRAVDAVAPRVRSAGRRMGVDGAAFDGLVLPDDASLREARMFPLRTGERLDINTGNVHQFGYLLSTIVRLAATDPAITQDPAARADLQVIAAYLARDFLRFYWTQAPAWHWVAPYPGGMRARTLARLNDATDLDKRRFFRAFLDYDMHVMAVAADLRAASRNNTQLLSAADQALVGDVNAIAARVLAERIGTGRNDFGFSFDRGFWDDNPIAEFAACRDRSLPARPCPLKNYTTDISHAQRWPAWLESFAAAAEDSAQRRRIDGWRRSLAQRVGADIRYDGGRLKLPNFLDGRDGWMIVTGSEGGRGAHPPSSMTGWAMRYGFYARLAPLDGRIARAQTRFCGTIESVASDDVSYRKANYGEPETNPANPLRPQADEYGRASPYAHICRMMELQGFVTPSGQAI